MLKILLTGKNGQVGRELAALLPRLGEVFATDRKELDLSKLDSIRSVVRRMRPHLIVNAAAYTAVDQAESEPELARTINAQAPGILAEEAKKLDAALVHFSTDYVFDGLKTSPYTEDDATAPLSVYGRTKLEGEEGIRGSGARHLILRSEWIYDTQGKNFLLTILRLATQQPVLRVVKDQIGSPTWSRCIAAGTVSILAKVCARATADSWTQVSGTYHLTAGGQASWYEFARAILEDCAGTRTLGDWIAAATGGKPLLAREVFPVLTSEFPRPARRPPYSVLSSRKVEETFGVRLPEWRAQLRLALSGGAVDPASLSSP